MKLGELLELDFKSKSITLDELKEGLQRALSLPIITKQPPIAAAISAVLTALTVYTTVITIYETILALYPKIKLATKAGAVPMNPAMAAELAQDLLLEAQKMAMEAAINAVKNLKQTILDTEIPGT